MAEAELAELRARLQAAEREMAREATSMREMSPSAQYVASSKLAFSNRNRGREVNSWVAGEAGAGGPRHAKLRGMNAPVMFAASGARVVPSGGGGAPGVAHHGQSRLPPLLPLKPSEGGASARSAGASELAQPEEQVTC